MKKKEINIDKKEKSLNNAKEDGKTLFTISLCIIFVMLIFYFGMNVSRGTYSASNFTCNTSDCANDKEDCEAGGGKFILDANEDGTCKFNFAECAAGTYKKANSWTCSPCESGSYCSGGTFYENGVEGLKSCSSGYNLSEPNSKKLDDCYKEISVVAGKYYNHSDELEDCPKGAYCAGGTVRKYDAGGKMPYGIITSCGEGRTTDGTGKTSESDCHDCPNIANVKSWITNGCTIKECNTGYVKKGDYCVSETENGKVDKPTCNNMTYNGAVRTLISKNDGYTVTYNGKSDKPINAGSYAVVVKLNPGYEWSDGSTSDYSLTCSVSKYTPEVSIYGIEVTKGSSKNISGSVVTTKYCGGTLTLSASNDNITLNNTTRAISGTNIDPTTSNYSSTVNGKKVGEAEVIAKFTPSSTSNCNTVTEKANVTVKDGSNDKCTVSINMPEKVELGASFDVTSNVKGLDSGVIPKYKWSCSGEGLKGTNISKDDLTKKTIKVDTYEYERAYSVNCSLSIYIGDESKASCSTSASTIVGNAEYDSNKVKITFKNYDGSTLGTMNTSTIEGLPNAIMFPGVDDYPALKSFTKDNKTYVFNGWGGSAGCKTGTYAANNIISRVSTSATYYACFDVLDEEASDDFTLKSCNFTQWINVVSDGRYLNCERSNIIYGGGNRDLNTRGNIKKCCIDSGYTWVGENFNSSTGGEYCIRCGKDVVVCDNSKNGLYSSSDFAKKAADKNCSDGATISKESNNCYKYTCKSSPTCDDSANSKFSTEAKAKTEGDKKCASGTKVVVSKESNNCYKYTCESTPTPKPTCDDSANSKFSTEAKAKAEGKKNCASGTTVSVSKDSNNCYKYTCKKKSSGSTEIHVNPPTGNILIIVVWAIGILIVGYAIWYFKNVKDSN